MPGTRKLGRTTDHRMSMLRGQVTYLLEKGRIETTVTRAKEVKALADKMVTLGKSGTLAARRQAMTFITKESVVKKLFDVVAPAFADKNGGYTRVLRIGARRGDAAEMAIVEVIGFEPKPEDEKKAKKAPKAAKKEEKAEKKAEKPEETAAPEEKAEA